MGSERPAIFRPSELSAGRPSEPPKAPIATSVRFEPDVKAALAKAAKDDTRSFSSMVTKIVVDWLKAKGYLK
jgi:hypothetical protein